ncbi:hypothetical protein LZC95_30880 [Pendulispora brunnea]|uniref:Glycosyltransferase RgtA/B/C/D-like domain-containing protein n=1 Tax=Pendulispora brunnea TaxID=2905690 RepID=A0ABZ2K3B6_9BACT
MMAFAGAWGFLPLAIPAAVFLSLRLGTIVFPDHATHRAVGGLVLAAAAMVAGVRVLGAFDLATSTTLLVALLVATTAAALVRRHQRTAFPLRGAVTRDVLPLLLLACGTIGVAVLTARWVPIWHWDSAGYHLPFVNFFLGAHGQSGVPPDIPYLSTYPHNIEMLYVALRAMLPDDRLVDLGQIPLGIMGSVATTAIARQLGADRPEAIAAGCAWLLVPVAFLQLPTNYVDIGSAAFLLSAIYFVLAPPSVRTVLVAGVALGLFLGSKPNAPSGTVLLFAILGVRCWRARHARLLPPALVAGIVILLLGAESYVQNLILHGNPVWPVRIGIGPWRLPGLITIDDVLATAPALPRVHGPFVLRTLRAWSTLGGVPVTFDMRMGGLGPLFLVCLPLAVVTLVQRRSVMLLIATLATLMSPEPGWARFILGFVALVFALATTQVSRLRDYAQRRGWRWAPHTRTLVLSAVTAMCVWQLGYAWPALTGEGPPLFAYANMTDDERMRAVGPDGPPIRYIEARKRIRDDETFAFDLADELPYFGWDSNLRYRGVAIPRNLTYDQVPDFLQRENVRIFVAGDGTPTGQWAKSHPAHFAVVFPCRWESCSAYERF